MVQQHTASTHTTPPWQTELAEAIRDPAALIDRLDLDRRLLPAARQAAGVFPLRVPQGYLARIRPGDPDDPLLRQVLPMGAELEDPPGFNDDPVGDGAAAVEGGILHKYHGRVLLMTTGACAVNCRYCFRRHFPYAEINASARRWRPALDYLAANREISEVILSGGDPLSLTDRRLAELADALAEIPHIRRLRVHSRLPVMIPARVDDSLLAWLAGTRLQSVMVLHVNHPGEIDAHVRRAVTRLRDAEVAVLNQAVLLRGVNDDAATLVSLSERLFEAGILPYYLHLLDRVRGAAHFEVDEGLARRIMDRVTATLPGYLVPRLVREDAGAPAKTRIV